MDQSKWGNKVGMKTQEYYSTASSTATGEFVVIRCCFMAKKLQVIPQPATPRNQSSLDVSKPAVVRGLTLSHPHHCKMCWPLCLTST